MCNPLYSAYFTRPGKDRLTVLGVLYPQAARQYCLNAAALQLLEHITLARATRRCLTQWQSTDYWDEETFFNRLDTELPTLTPYQRQWVVTAAAIAAYQANRTWPIIRTLVCDDAPQFDWLTAQLMLCSVHEGALQEADALCGGASDVVGRVPDPLLTISGGDDVKGKEESNR